VTLAVAVAIIAISTAATRPPAAHGGELIGGIGLTHLTVYDQRPAPDGQMSGTPHVHAITDEGYYTISGTGKVELHDLKAGFRTVDLSPGRYIQFSPGTLHRLINTDHLVLLVIIGNAGLAEQGDARIYFGKAIDEDPAEYARLVGLAKTAGLEGALDRRDAAIRAYAELIALWKNDRDAYFRELERFVGVHMKAAEGLRPRFAKTVETGPVAWSERFQRRLKDLPNLGDEPVPLRHAPSGDTTFGMCGILRPMTKFEPLGPAREQ
jgi:mannose-6-phosphate isomerase-like protein (cupin superfamily)